MYKINVRVISNYTNTPHDIKVQIPSAPKYTVKKMYICYHRIKLKLYTIYNNNEWYPENVKQ